MASPCPRLGVCITKTILCLAKCLRVTVRDTCGFYSEVVVNAGMACVDVSNELLAIFFLVYGITAIDPNSLCTVLACVTMARFSGSGLPCHGIISTG